MDKRERARRRPVEAGRKKGKDKNESALAWTPLRGDGASRGSRLAGTAQSAGETPLHWVQRYAAQSAMCS